MNQPAAAHRDNPGRTPGSARETASIATRFGDLPVDPEKVISFDRGLYGLEDRHRFLLTDVPGWPVFFKLMQAIDDPKLSLIVLPLEAGDGPIDRLDFDEACRTLGYDPVATAVIGIVTMREDDGSRLFTVNLKAPLLIDSHRRKGHQHVFASEKYPLRHPLETQLQIGA